jgi:hypothetical protein
VAGLLAFLAGGVLLPALLAEEPDSATMAEREYVLAVKLLREQHEQIEHAQSRLDRLERAYDYLRRIVRNPRLSADEKKAYRRQSAYFKAEARRVSEYIRKTGATYLKNVEKYIAGLQASKYPQFAEWERARKAFWRGGKPRTRLQVSPWGRISMRQPLRLVVDGAPPGCTCTWEASAGEIRELKGADPPSSAAVWNSRNRPGAVISVRVAHPRLPMPVVLFYTVQSAGLHAGVSPGLMRRYEGALAKLIALETGREQLLAEEALTKEKIGRARRKGAPADSPTLQRLGERRREMKESLRSNDIWVEYLDAYLLPHLADGDRSGVAAAWERQRVEFRELAPEGRSFPWQIAVGERMAPGSWHFVIPGLPEGTEVDWSLLTEHQQKVEEEGEPLPGDAGGVVLDPPAGAEHRILRARVKLLYHSVPIRMDWVLPAAQ